MQTLSSISDRFAGRAAILAGVALTAGGITEIIHSQRHAGNRVVGVAGYLTLSFFVVALISLAPSFIALARRARTSAAMKAAVVNGHDLGMFNVIAPLTNAAWLVASVVIAVSLKRAGTVRSAVAVALPLAWVATIPLATVGGGVLSGAYYLTIGYLLTTGTLDHTPSAAPQPAAA
jgi:hypothetical protein